jgi:hypothetical protein
MDNMPNIGDLQTMYGSWNPQAYLEAQENAGLARQMYKEKMAQEEQATRKSSLDNMFTEQDMPARLEERVLKNKDQGVITQGRVLDNTGKVTTNRSNELDLQRKEAMHKFGLEQDQLDAVLKASETQLKQADTQAEMMIRSNDPAVQKQGLYLASLTKSARELKMKHEQDMEKTRYEQTESNKRAAGNNAATIKAAQIGADSRITAASMRGAGKVSLSIQEQVASGKLTYERAAVMLSGAAMMEEDPDKKAALEQQAVKYEQAAKDLRNASAAGKIDVAGQAGLPTQQVPNVLGSTGAQPAPKPTAPTPPKQGAVVSKGGKKWQYLGGDPASTTSWKEIK